jgi:membrane protease YdiL (CAAX protease family)
MSRIIAPPVGWSFMLMAIFVGGTSLFGTPFTAWRIYSQNRYAPSIGDIALISTASFALTCWIAVLLSKRSWRELLAMNRPAPALIPASVILALGMAIVCSEIYNATISLLPMPKFFSDLFEGLFDVKATPVMGTLALVVVAPITEEFICRRWLLESLLQRYRPGLSIAISAAAFGVMHLNPWQFFYATVLGLGLGWLYWRTRSVVLCMLWHGVNNSLAVIFAYWELDIEGFRRTEGSLIEFHPWWLNGVGVGLLLIGGSLLWCQTRRSLQTTNDAQVTQTSQTPPPLPAVIAIPPVLPPESRPPQLDV